MQAVWHSLAATEEEIDEIVVDKPLDGDEDEESEEDEYDVLGYAMLQLYDIPLLCQFEVAW